MKVMGEEATEEQIQKAKEANRLFREAITEYRSEFSSDEFVRNYSYEDKIEWIADRLVTLFFRARNELPSPVTWDVYRELYEITINTTGLSYEDAVLVHLGW